MNILEYKRLCPYMLFYLEVKFLHMKSLRSKACAMYVESHYLPTAHSLRLIIRHLFPATPQSLGCCYLQRLPTRSLGERDFTVKTCLSRSEGRGCKASGCICVSCFRPVYPVDSETSPLLVQSTVPGQAQSKGPTMAD